MHLHEGIFESWYSGTQRQSWRRVKMGKGMKLKAKAFLAGTFSLPISMAALDHFLNFHEGKSQRKIHRPLFQIHASHNLPQLLPSAGYRHVVQVKPCLSQEFSLPQRTPTVCFVISFNLMFHRSQYLSSN